MSVAAWLIPEAARVSPPLYLLTVSAAVLLTGFSKGGFGGGLGILATPLFMQVLPARLALAMMLPVLIVCDLFTLRHFPREWDPTSFRRIAGGMIVGLIIGTLLLILLGSIGATGDRILKLAVGGLSLAFCLLKFSEPLWKKRSLPTEQKADDAPPSRPGWAIGTFLGILGGMATMLAHAAGQIVGVHFLSHRLPPGRFVGTTARFYLIFNTLKIPFFLLAGALSREPYLTLDTLRWNLWMFPIGGAGVAAGAWLNRRMNATLFTWVVYALLFVTGLRMVFSTW